MPPTLDPFATLGVSPGCLPADLRKAFRQMARVNHPDKGGDPEKFRLIAEAYDKARAFDTSSSTAGTAHEETHKRYDWRRGRASFQTRGDTTKQKKGEVKRRGGRDRDGDGGAVPRGRGEHVHDHDRTPPPTEPTEEEEHDHASSSSDSSGVSSSSDSDRDDWECGSETRRHKKYPTNTLLAARSRLDGTRHSVVSVACSPTGLVAVCCLGGGVRLWCAATGTVEDLDVPTFASVDDDDEDEKEKARDDEEKEKRASDAWWVFTTKHAGSLLVAFEDGGLVLWPDVDVVRGTTDQQTPPRSGTLGKVAKDIAGDDPLGDQNQNQKQKSHLGTPKVLRGHSDRVVAAAWVDGFRENRPTGTGAHTTHTLCTASLDTTVGVWRFERRNRVPNDGGSVSVKPEANFETVFVSKTVFREHASGVSCCAISIDGNFLATGDTSGVFCVWDLPANALAQKTKWVGGEDDAITKCTFTPGGDEETNARFRGHGLVTAHYSREGDHSRLLVWQVGRRNVRFRQAETRSAGQDGEDGQEDWEDSNSECSNSGESETPALDHRGRYAELRGYVGAVPSGVRTFRGRISTIALGWLEDESPVLVACGVHGWVTAVDTATFGTLFHAEGACEKHKRVGGRRESRVGVHKARFVGNAVFVTAGEDGTVTVWDAEDGTETLVCLFRDGGDKKHVSRKGKIWSVDGWTDAFGKTFVVAGFADGDAACWETTR